MIPRINKNAELMMKSYKNKDNNDQRVQKVIKKKSSKSKS